MRVLFLTPIFPVPVDSGIRKRMVATLRTLATVGDVTLVGLCKESPPSGFRTGVLELCRDVIALPDPTQAEATGRRNWRSRLQGLKARLLDPRPLYTRLFDSAVLHQTLRSVRPETFDLVWVQSLALYGQLVPYHLPRVAVDLPDADSIKVRRQLREYRPGVGLALEALELVKLRHAERNWGADRHWFIVCSENDRKHLSRKADKVWVVRNGVELPSELDSSTEESHTLVYVGTFAYKPNRDAVIYFTRRILPLILQRCPEARFYIVGSSPTPEIKRLHSEPRVIVTGYVDNVEPYVRSASVAVVPLLNAAGTRIKILEAMSYSKPVVATSIGADGLAVEHGRNILLADTPRGFASCCIQLLSDASLRSQIGNAGRQFVEANHGLEQVEEDLQSFLSTAFSIELTVEAGNRLSDRLVRK